ncbi:MAG: FtsX-like permease family protein [Crocinitomicaceae bacterium]
MSRTKIILDITKTHLISRYKQTLVAAFGVTFGIGAYIILMGFMTGLNNLLDGLILNRTPHIRLYNELEPSEHQPIDKTAKYEDYFNVVSSVKPRNVKSNIHNALPIIENLRKDDRVKSVTPQVAVKVFYMAGKIDLNGMMTGIEVKEEVRSYNFDDYIVEGDPLALDRDPKGIFLGVGIAKKLSVSIGDLVQVGTITGGKFTLKVIGMYQSGIADVDDMQSFVSIKTAQKIMGESNSYFTDINIKLWDKVEAAPMSEELKSQYDLSAIDIDTANAQFDTGSSIRSLISYAVSITLLIVAGFGIYNILNMLIYEKMDDIAILKATGFSGKDVSRIFISQALLIGFIGGVLGLIVGYFGCLAISHTPFETEALPTVKFFPIYWDPMTYVIGIIFALISTFFAGFFPSRKASKIDPVEIIRGK